MLKPLMQLLFVLIITNVNGNAMEAVAIIKGVGGAIKEFASIFKTKRTSVIATNDPRTCTTPSKCGLEYLNARYSSNQFMKTRGKIATHIIEQFEGTIFEEYINKKFGKDPTITFNDGYDMNVSAIFKSRNGAFGGFHIGWKRLDTKNDPDLKEACDAANEFHKLSPKEPCFDVYTSIQNVQFTLAQLTVVMQHSKSSLTSDKHWSEVIHYDPNLTDDAMKGIVYSIVNPMLTHYEQIGIAPGRGIGS